MSQQVYPDIDPNVTSGTQLSVLLNDFRDALLTQHSGSVAPSYAEVGTEWLDTSTANKLVFKKYDGTQWVSTFTIDDIAHSLALGGNNPVASVTVTRTDTSADMIEMFRDTSTPTDGGLIYSQNNDGLVKTTMAKLVFNSDSNTSGSEESSMTVQTMDVGTLKDVYKVSKDAIFYEALKGTGQRQVVVDANGNLSTEVGGSEANLITNGTADSGELSAWTATSLSFLKSTTTSELIGGASVFKAVSSADLETLETELVTLANEHINHPMIVSLKYKCSADWTIEILDESNVVLASETLNAFTPVLNEANSKKMFVLVPSSVTGLSVRLTSTAADTLLFDNMEMFSLIQKEEELYFERDIQNNQANIDLFDIASTKNKLYKVEARIARETDSNYAESVVEFFISYDQNGTTWRVAKETVSDLESLETEVDFNMNGVTLRYTSSDISGTNYTGKINGKITRVL